MNKSIGIVGSRRRNQDYDYHALLNVFDSVYEEGDSIVSGGCHKGGDKFANWIAKARGLTITVHYPNWKRFGKGAGFIRNTKIANDCNVLIAMVSEDRSGGTEDTVEKCVSQGKKIYFVEEKL